jgi:hypothetical protein
LGRVALARYLVDEIQEVYRLQGVKINDKHIEVIVRQMLRRVNVVDPGDSRFLPNEQVERAEVEEANSKLVAEGLRPATWKPILLGITKASLSTESFIFGRFLPGNDESTHGSQYQQSSRPFAWLERERDHGSSDPGRYGCCLLPESEGCGSWAENVPAGQSADQALEVAHQ